MHQLIPRLFLADYLHLHWDDAAFVNRLGLQALVMKAEIIERFRPDFEGGRGLDLDQVLVEVIFNIISRLTPQILAYGDHAGACRVFGGLKMASPAIIIMEISLRE